MSDQDLHTTGGATGGGIPWDETFLQTYRVKLVDGITPVTLQQVLDQLVAKRFLTEEEEDLIKADGKTRKDKIRNLLRMLPSKGQRAISAFKTALANVDAAASDLVKGLDALEAESSLR